MAPCPVRLLAHKYDRLAEHWLEHEDDATHDELGMMVASVEQLTPESLTGVTFLVGCALSEMDVIVRGGDAPHIRLAAGRRVLKILRRAFVFLADPSDELPSAWSFVLPAGEGHLKQSAL